MGSETVRIYTDGACRGNPGPGGWGAVLEYGDSRRTLRGGEPETTNNRMELVAVIKALECLKRPCAVELTTDSRYVQQGITVWIEDWKRKGWRRPGKKPLLNLDLWQELDGLAARHEIAWRWVKGHSGHPGNELADQLANQGIDELPRE